MNELKELENIIDKIIPENVNYFDDLESLELYETCFQIMEEFMEDNHKIITDPEFEDIFDENISELFYSQFENCDIFYTEEAEEEMEEIIEKAKIDFFKERLPIRSCGNSVILYEPNNLNISAKIDKLRNKPQPVQRTEEWYKFRHNLITASNAFKAFENQKVKNQLIYEKCQPLNSRLFIDKDKENDASADADTDNNEDCDNKIIKMVNVNSPLHWGQKYEPLSVLLYESMYNTTIEDFGCIQHDTYKFIGASPDGINVAPQSPRYGRMLEIKNIVNRKIDGIPKKAYWVQMQLQMEVCDLDECDFLETKFVEYETYDEYVDDKSDKKRGVIMYFHTNEGKPFYKYMPLNLVSIDDINNWFDETLNLYQSAPYNYIWIKNCYWRLEEFSCVLVQRNNKWFNDNVKELEDIWKIIEKERVSGFEHRAPTRRQKKDDSVNNLNVNSSQNGCLLNYNKENGKITVIKNNAPNILSFITQTKKDVNKL
jgi:putative phage-type endonuclease